MILRLPHRNPDRTRWELRGNWVLASARWITACLGSWSAGSCRLLISLRNPKTPVMRNCAAPAGIAEKTLLSSRLLKRKIEGYEALRSEIERLSREIIPRSSWDYSSGNGKAIWLAQTRA